MYTGRSTRRPTDTLAPLLALLLAIAVAADLRASDGAAGVKKHRKPQKTPIQLGTSGGNAQDLNVGAIACVSNTLGGLVEGDVQYVLSSNGTLARRNDAEKGEPIMQPGLRDTKRGACNTNNPKGHTVADLTKFKKLKFGGRKKNVVDASLAEVRPGMVDPAGAVLGIGTPGSDVLEPFLGQQVRKSGRGTGVVAGTVTAVNVTVDVSYLVGAVRFAKQFVVESNSNKEIYTSGDSGAIFFENESTCPGWVGLAVAGSTPTGRLAWASPMSTVLKQLSKVKPKGDLAPVGCVANRARLEEATVSSRLLRDVDDARRIQRRLERDVLRLRDVVGMGIGLASDDLEKVVFKIFVEGAPSDVRAQLPQRLGRLEYEVQAIGRASAF